jgi:mutator protein MutT
MSQMPVPAVRAIIVDEQNRVLLLRRRENSQGGGQWCLPGGKVDYNQQVADAVAREIAEETSLNCVQADFLFYQDSPSLKPGGMHCINFVFKCTVEGEIVLNPESTEYAWVTPDSLQDYTIAFRNNEIVERFFNTA